MWAENAAMDIECLPACVASSYVQEPVISLVGKLHLAHRGGLQAAQMSHLAGQQVQIEAGIATPPAPQHEHAASRAAAVAEHQNLQRQHAWSSWVAGWTHRQLSEERLTFAPQAKHLACACRVILPMPGRARSHLARQQLIAQLADEGRQARPQRGCVHVACLPWQLRR